MKLIKVIKEWRRHNKAERELYALTDHELRDIGISRGMIPAIVRGHNVHKDS